MNTCESPKCIKLKYGKRFCKEHYNKNHIPKRIYNTEDRFWSYLYSVDDSCWVWGGRIIKGGYGQMLAEDKIKLAHRWSFENFVGEIPEDMTIDHICNNPPCVNPSHLQLLSQRDNNYKSPAYTGNRTYCPQGHEYTQENTYIRPNLKGYKTWRDCRKCISARSRRSYQKRKAHV